MGYLNFEDINGASVFSDFEYRPLKYKITPVGNLKIGYTHIWNQYDHGTGAGIFEATAGVDYRINNRFDVYVKSGVSFIQQVCFFLVTLGFGF